VKHSKAKTSPAPDRVPGFDQKRPTGKLGNMLDAVAYQRGASRNELVELTGWQPYGTGGSLAAAPALL
jgi:hypothetical protein